MSAPAVHQYASTPHVVRRGEECRCTICHGTVRLRRGAPPTLRMATLRLFRDQHRLCRRTP